MPVPDAEDVVGGAHRGERCREVATHRQLRLRSRGVGHESPAEDVIWSEFGDVCERLHRVRGLGFLDPFPVRKNIGEDLLVHDLHGTVTFLVVLVPWLEHALEGAGALDPLEEAYLLAERHHRVGLERQPPPRTRPVRRQHLVHAVQNLLDALVLAEVLAGLGQPPVLLAVGPPHDKALRERLRRQRQQHRVHRGHLHLRVLASRLTPRHRLPGHHEPTLVARDPLEGRQLRRQVV
mmetsp:Transcript_56010/g.131285  ORF Transcript_56010/g.131285 Transcript_56010/m.131285 type:complete len:236 (-) Transcript_56010:873-1580(-)